MVWFAGWLWQGVALTLLTALVLHTSRAVNAATRYALWWLTLLVIFAHPVTSLAPWLSPAALDLPDAPAAPGATLFSFTVPHLPAWIATVAATAWLFAVLCNAIRFAIAVRGVRELRRSASPVDPVIEAALPLWRAASDCGRPTRLCASDRAQIPCALGLGSRAMVIVPRRLLDTLDRRDLDQIVVHEHAHLQRYDDWGRFLQVLIELLVPFHPAVRWVAARLDLEREIASDDWVIERTGQPASYARCLTRLAEQIVPGAAPTLTPAALRRRAQMLSRVERLLDPARNARPRISAWAAVVLAIVLIALSGRAVRLLGIHEAAVFDPIAEVHAEETLASHEFLNADALSLTNLPSLDLGEPAHAATPAAVRTMSARRGSSPAADDLPVPSQPRPPAMRIFSRRFAPFDADAPDGVDWREVEATLHALDERRMRHLRPLSAAFARLADGNGPPDGDDEEAAPRLPLQLDADSVPPTQDELVIHPDLPFGLPASLHAPSAPVGVPKKPQFFSRVGRSVARLFGLHVRSPGSHKPVGGKKKSRAEAPRRADQSGRQTPAA